MRQCRRPYPLGNWLSKADAGVRRPPFGAKTKEKTQKYACNREIRRRDFSGGMIRVGLVTKTGDRQHGKGSRQCDCPASDMIDLHQCRLAVDAANSF
jgi:hypothetical protein